MLRFSSRKRIQHQVSPSSSSSVPSSSSSSSSSSYVASRSGHTYLFLLQQQQKEQRQQKGKQTSTSINKQKSPGAAHHIDRNQKGVSSSDSSTIYKEQAEKQNESFSKHSNLMMGKDEDLIRHSLVEKDSLNKHNNSIHHQQSLRLSKDLTEVLSQCSKLVDYVLQQQQANGDDDHKVHGTTINNNQSSSSSSSSLSHWHRAFELLSNSIMAQKKGLADNLNENKQNTEIQSSTSSTTPNTLHYNLALAIASKCRQWHAMQQCEQEMAVNNIQADSHTLNIFMAASLSTGDWMNTLELFDSALSMEKERKLIITDASLHASSESNHNHHHQQQQPHLNKQSIKVALRASVEGSQAASPNYSLLFSSSSPTSSSTTAPENNSNKKYHLFEQQKLALKKSFFLPRWREALVIHRDFSSIVEQDTVMLSLLVKAAMTRAELDRKLLSAWSNEWKGRHVTPDSQTLVNLSQVAERCGDWEVSLGLASGAASVSAPSSVLKQLVSSAIKTSHRAKQDHAVLSLFHHIIDDNTSSSSINDQHSSGKKNSNNTNVVILDQDSFSVTALSCARLGKLNDLSKVRERAVEDLGFVPTDVFQAILKLLDRHYYYHVSSSSSKSSMLLERQKQVVRDWLSSSPAVHHQQQQVGGSSYDKKSNIVFAHHHHHQHFGQQIYQRFSFDSSSFNLSWDNALRQLAEQTQNPDPMTFASAVEILSSSSSLTSPSAIYNNNDNNTQDEDDESALLTILKAGVRLMMMSVGNKQQYNSNNVGDNHNQNLYRPLFASSILSLLETYERTMNKRQAEVNIYKDNYDENNINSDNSRTNNAILSDVIQCALKLKFDQKNPVFQRLVEKLLSGGQTETMKQKEIRNTNNTDHHYQSSVAVHPLIKSSSSSSSNELLLLSSESLSRVLTTLGKINQLLAGSGGSDEAHHEQDEQTHNDADEQSTSTTRTTKEDERDWTLLTEILKDIFNPNIDINNNDHGKRSSSSSSLVMILSLLRKLFTSAFSSSSEPLLASRRHHALALLHETLSRFELLFQTSNIGVRNDDDNNNNSHPQQSQSTINFPTIKDSDLDGWLDEDYLQQVIASNNNINNTKNDSGNDSNRSVNNHNSSKNEIIIERTKLVAEALVRVARLFYEFGLVSESLHHRLPTRFAYSVLHFLEHLSLLVHHHHHHNRHNDTREMTKTKLKNIERFCWTEANEIYSRMMTTDGMARFSNRLILAKLCAIAGEDNQSVVDLLCHSVVGRREQQQDHQTFTDDDRRDVFEGENQRKIMMKQIAEAFCEIRNPKVASMIADSFGKTIPRTDRVKMLLAQWNHHQSLRNNNKHDSVLALLSSSSFLPPSHHSGSRVTSSSSALAAAAAGGRNPEIVDLFISHLRSAPETVTTNAISMVIEGINIIASSSSSSSSSSLPQPLIELLSSIQAADVSGKLSGRTALAIVTTFNTNPSQVHSSESSSNIHTLRQVQLVYEQLMRQTALECSSVMISSDPSWQAASAFWIVRLSKQIIALSSTASSSANATTANSSSSALLRKLFRDATSNFERMIMSTANASELEDSSFPFNRFRNTLQHIPRSTLQLDENDEAAATLLQDQSVEFVHESCTTVIFASMLVLQQEEGKNPSSRDDADEEDQQLNSSNNNFANSNNLLSAFGVGNFDALFQSPIAMRRSFSSTTNRIVTNCNDHDQQQTKMMNMSHATGTLSSSSLIWIASGISWILDLCPRLSSFSSSSSSSSSLLQLRVDTIIHCLANQMMMPSSQPQQPSSSDETASAQNIEFFLNQLLRFSSSGSSSSSKNNIESILLKFIKPLCEKILSSSSSLPGQQLLETCPTLAMCYLACVELQQVIDAEKATTSSRRNETSEIVPSPQITKTNIVKAIFKMSRVEEKMNEIRQFLLQSTESSSSLAVEISRLTVLPLVMGSHQQKEEEQNVSSSSSSSSLFHFSAILFQVCVQNESWKLAQMVQMPVVSDDERGVNNSFLPELLMMKSSFYDAALEFLLRATEDKETKSCTLLKEILQGHHHQHENSQNRSQYVVPFATHALSVLCRTDPVFKFVLGMKILEKYLIMMMMSLSSCSTLSSRKAVYLLLLQLIKMKATCFSSALDSSTRRERVIDSFHLLLQRNAPKIVLDLLENGREENDDDLTIRREIVNVFMMTKKDRTESNNNNNTPHETTVNGGDKDSSSSSSVAVANLYFFSSHLQKSSLKKRSNDMVVEMQSSNNNKNNNINNTHQLHRQQRRPIRLSTSNKMQNNKTKTKKDFLPTSSLVKKLLGIKEEGGSGGGKLKEEDEQQPHLLSKEITDDACRWLLSRPSYSSLTPVLSSHDDYDNNQQQLFVISSSISLASVYQELNFINSLSSSSSSPNTIVILISNNNTAIDFFVNAVDRFLMNNNSDNGQMTKSKMMGVSSSSSSLLSFMEEWCCSNMTMMISDDENSSSSSPRSLSEVARLQITFERLLKTVTESCAQKFTLETNRQHATFSLKWTTKYILAKLFENELLKGGLYYQNQQDEVRELVTASCSILSHLSTLCSWIGDSESLVQILKSHQDHPFLLNSSSSLSSKLSSFYIPVSCCIKEIRRRRRRDMMSDNHQKQQQQQQQMSSSTALATTTSVIKNLRRLSLPKSSSSIHVEQEIPKLLQRIAVSLKTLEEENAANNNKNSNMNEKKITTSIEDFIRKLQLSSSLGDERNNYDNNKSTKQNVSPPKRSQHNREYIISNNDRNKKIHHTTTSSDRDKPEELLSSSSSSGKLSPSKPTSLSVPNITSWQSLKQELYRLAKTSTPPQNNNKKMKKSSSSAALAAAPPHHQPPQNNNKKMKKSSSSAALAAAPPHHQMELFQAILANLTKDDKSKKILDQAPWEDASKVLSKLCFVVPTPTMPNHNNNTNNNSNNNNNTPASSSVMIYSSMEPFRLDFFFSLARRHLWRVERQSSSAIVAKTQAMQMARTALEFERKKINKQGENSDEDGIISNKEKNNKIIRSERLLTELMKHSSSMVHDQNEENTDNDKSKTTALSPSRATFTLQLFDQLPCLNNNDQNDYPDDKKNDDELHSLDTLLFPLAALVARQQKSASATTTMSKKEHDFLCKVGDKIADRFLALPMVSSSKLLIARDDNNNSSAHKPAAGAGDKRRKFIKLLSSTSRFISAEKLEKVLARIGSV